MNKKSVFLLTITAIAVVFIGLYTSNNKEEKLASGIENYESKKSEEKKEIDSTKEVESRGELKYSAMGDSLTNGFYASTKEKRFTNVFANMLHEKLGYDVILGEDSQYGGTSKNGINGLEAIKSQQPDLVTIEFGTNDSDPDNGSDLNTFIANINIMIDSLLDQENPPDIVLVTTWGQGEKAIPFDNAIKDIGKERDIPVADIYDVWVNSSENMGPAGVETFLGTSDNWHPNDKGMKRIAEKIFSASEKMLVD